MNHVTIQQRGAEPNRPVLTKGTVVYVGDSPINGVTRITLTAEVNDLWRGTIEVLPGAMPVMRALIDVRRPIRRGNLKARLAVQRAKAWEVETTSLDRRQWPI